MSGENRERESEEGEDGLSFDAVQAEELPEWATEEASVPDETGDGADDGADAGGGDDGPEDAAAAVNFANVRTGASESVAVGEGGRRVTAETVDSPDAVGFSTGTGQHDDTAGTSLAPDLDEVDPGEFLDDQADEEFPRPGADDGSDAADGAAGGTTGGTTTGRATAEARGRGGATAGTGGARLGGSSALPDDPALAFGLGMGVMLVVAAVYFLLASTIDPLPAAAVLLGVTLVLGGAAYALDPFDRRR